MFVHRSINDVAVPHINPESLQKQLGDITSIIADDPHTYAIESDPHHDEAFQFQQVCIHTSFLKWFPDSVAILRVKECFLPHIPVCPGPYLLPDKDALPRPAPTKYFIHRFPSEASVYSKVIGLTTGGPMSIFPGYIWMFGTPNYGIMRTNRSLLSSALGGR